MCHLTVTQVHPIARGNSNGLGAGDPGLFKHHGQAHVAGIQALASKVFIQSELGSHRKAT